MRQDNRGMTLVELIIAVTVSVIVMGAATMFIRNALKSYEVASNSIDLQMEAQVLMEQIATWIMEGNRVEIQGDALIVYDIPRAVDASKIPIGVPVPDSMAAKRIIWPEGGKLYMVVLNETAADTQADGTNLFYSTDMSNIRGHANILENCIGDYVIEFLPTATDVGGRNLKVTIQIKLKEGIQEYELGDEIKIRNELVMKEQQGGNKDENA